MHGKMTCGECHKEFGTLMASCGTGTTYSVFKCPHCGHYHTVERNYSPIEMLKTNSIGKQLLKEHLGLDNT